MGSSMEWQPISSAPDEEYDILVAWSDRTIGILDGHSARSNMKTMVSGDYLTHWMLLPEPPQ